MKKIFVLLLSLALMGCSSSNNDSTENNSNAVKNESIKIEELEWSVADSMDGDFKYVGFNYTNNSKYPVIELSMKFVLNKDVTDDQLKIFDEKKKESSWTDEEVKNISISCRVDKMTLSGESIKNQWCGYKDTYNTVEDIDHFDVMKPDSMAITYLDNDKIYKTNYNFETKKYIEDANSGISAYEWPVNEMTNMLPKPDVTVGRSTSNDNDYFSFLALGITKDFFDSYVAQCKNKGFTENIDSSNHLFEAKNKEGHEINITYYEDSASVRITLSSPEKSE